MAANLEVIRLPWRGDPIDPMYNRLILHLDVVVGANNVLQLFYYRVQKGSVTVCRAQSVTFVVNDLCCLLIICAT